MATDSHELAHLAERSERGVEANAVRSADPQEGAPYRSPAPTRGEQTTMGTTPTPKAAPEPVVPEDILVVSSKPMPAVASGPKPDSKRKAIVGGAKPQASLEDEAQVLWERGELVAAEQKFREVLKVAGNRRRAELAYGDLFALVRQLPGADTQAAVWHEYLDRFPRGQFADDARAGLCQRAQVSERAACWRNYLVNHPEGAHRKQAEVQGMGVP